MSDTPRITRAVLVSALILAGFVQLQVRGGHYFLRHADGRVTVVPVYSGEPIGPGLLHKIMRDCEMSEDDLRRPR